MAMDRAGRLAAPLSALTLHWDAVVVGSGYGGSIVAARFAKERKASLRSRTRSGVPVR
jgi:hypothetical protein